jgi:hypothetical protein
MDEITSWLSQRSMMDLLPIVAAVGFAVWGAAKTIWSTLSLTSRHLAQAGRRLVTWWQKPSRLVQIEQKLDALSIPDFDKKYCLSCRATLGSPLPKDCPVCKSAVRGWVEYRAIKLEHPCH